MQYANFGNFIRKKRQRQNKTLNAFAFDCGIEPATLSNFERGKCDILFQTFTKIAYGFNNSPAGLLFEYESNKC